MASRRMFSLKIIDSAKFLKMPSSSRLLYFDLCMRADDDGVVEGFNVLRMTGATEDDLRVLVAKGFITILNEDLVAYIKDWNEHNKIRADRKVDSIYKDLLLKIIPDVKLIEPRKRADYKPKGNRTDNGQSKDSLGKDSLGKDSLGKDSLGEDTTTQPRSFPTPIHEVIFNQFGDVSYKTWFEDSVIEENGELVIINTTNSLKADVIKNKYAKVISKLTEKNVSVHYEEENNNN